MIRVKVENIAVAERLSSVMQTTQVINGDHRKHCLLNERCDHAILINVITLVLQVFTPEATTKLSIAQMLLDKSW